MTTEVYETEIRPLPRKQIIDKYMDIIDENHIGGVYESNPVMYAFLTILGARLVSALFEDNEKNGEMNR